MIVKFFQFRIPPPLIGFLFLIFLFFTREKFPFLDFPKRELIAWYFIFLGIVLDITSIYKFYSGQTTISPLKPDLSKTLIKTWPYTFSRNPMYLGMISLLWGVSLLVNQIAGVLGVPLIFLYLTIFQVKPEERILLEKFGDEYQDYKTKVRRWF